MTPDAVADSCVVAKWLLIEHDTDEANRFFVDVMSRGGRIVVLDLALIEVAQAIWKRVHRGLLTPEEGDRLTDALLVLPVAIEPSGPRLRRAAEIARTYGRSVYDALFVALAEELGLPGVTADEPLHRAIAADFPGVILLRDRP